MYETKISELRNQIDNLDNEIIDKIFILSQVANSFKLKISNCISNPSLKTLDIARLARDKNLDEKAILKIFKEIMELINEQETKLK
jgi:chorismate mutase